MLTGLGMTETAPFAICANARRRRSRATSACPRRACELKLVPLDGKTEVRYRGPNVMPGYWRAPEQTREAFDDEGFYRTGDAVKLDRRRATRAAACCSTAASPRTSSSSPAPSSASARCARRSSSLPATPACRTWWSTGINRDEIGLLIFPRARRLPCAVAGSPPTAPLPEVLHSAPVRAFFQDLVDRLWRAGTGSANRRGARLRAGRAAVDRQGRGHRQGLDQPARRAHAPRRAGRAPVRRPRRRRDRAALSPAPSLARPRTRLRVTIQFGDCDPPASSSIRIPALDGRRLADVLHGSAACRRGANWQDARHRRHAAARDQAPVRQRRHLRRGRSTIATQVDDGAPRCSSEHRVMRGAGADLRKAPRLRAFVRRDAQARPAARDPVPEDIGA